MTKLSFIIVLFLLLILNAFAQPSNPPPSVTLAWNIAAGAQTNVAGYWLWHGFEQLHAGGVRVGLGNNQRRANQCGARQYVLLEHHGAGDQLG